MELESSRVEGVRFRGRSRTPAGLRGSGGTNGGGGEGSRLCHSVPPWVTMEYSKQRGKKKKN